MKKVLIVDDDDFILDIYTRKFSTQGCDVTSCHSAREALEFLRKPDAYFDGIMLDILMPAYTGIQMLEDIKRENLCPQAAYIVLSNQGNQDDIDKALSLGVDGYIVKASTVPSEVFTEVIKTIDKKQSLQSS